MNNLTNVVERTGASLQSPVLVIIQHLVLNSYLPHQHPQKGIRRLRNPRTGDNG